MKDKRKVLMMADVDGAVGGINIWARHVVNYWKTLDASCIVIDTISSGRKDFTSFTKNKATRILDGIKAYSAFLRKVDRELQKEKYDVFHINSSASFGLFRDYLLLKKAHKKGVNTVLHFHFGRIPDLKVAQNREWRWLLKVSKMADKVVVLDQASLEALLSSGLKNVVKIPNPVAPYVLQHAIGGDEVRKGILYVGQCYRAKGIYELVEACKGIKDATLKLIGSCSDVVANELKTIESGENYLSLAGMKPYAEVIEEMKRCEVFVLPSYSEGFPNVILEAMACGCAIVSTTVGAIPELLNKNCGLLVAPREVAALRDAIKKLLDNPELCAKFGKNAKEKVKEYKIEIIWEKLMETWCYTNDE